MMAVDTSALVAIALSEPKGTPCLEALRREPQLLISAGTVVEALIVAERRGFADAMAGLIERFGFEIVPVTPGSARRAAAAYRRWGKGVHAAALNFGDCFSYELAEAHDCPLLFVGDDFSKTDLRAAL